jgi:hypothetical protein
MERVEQVEGLVPTGAWNRRLPRPRGVGGWAPPLLLGACPSAGLVLATLLPQTGPVAWGTEVVALGAVPCLLGVVDVSAADWRSDRGEGWHPGAIVGRLLALALALLAVVSAVKVATPAALYTDNYGNGWLAWLLLLACTTVICAAFITSTYRDKRAIRDIVHAVLAWFGFCLPVVVVLAVDVNDPTVNGGLFVYVFFYVCGLILVGMVVIALLLAPLAGLLGGRLRRLW